MHVDDLGNCARYAPAVPGFISHHKLDLLTNVRCVTPLLDLGKIRTANNSRREAIWGRGEWSIPQTAGAPSQAETQNPSLLTVNLGSPIRPRKLEYWTFASRLIEPLWAGFSFAARAEVCDLEYVCL